MIPQESDVERHLAHRLTYNERSMSSYPVGNTYIDGVLVYNDYKGELQDRDEYFVYCEDCEIRMDVKGLTIEPLSSIEAIVEVMKNGN